MLKAKVLKKTPKFEIAYRNSKLLDIKKALEKLNLQYKCVNEIDIYNIIQLIRPRGK